MDNILLKRIITGAIVLGIIVFGVYLINQYSEQSISNNNQKLLFTDLNLNDIYSLEYVIPDNSLKLERKDDKWFINGYLASSRVVEVTLSKVIALEVNYIASNDSNSYSIFEVGNDKSMVNINNGTFKLFVGKNTFDGGTFVRFSDSVTTLATSSTLNSILDNDVSFFRDKTITKLNPKDIIYLSINDSVYIKENDKWLRDSLEIKSTGINSLLAKVSNLEGIAFAEEKDVNTIENINPYLNIVIKTSNSEYKFNYRKYKENIYAKTNLQTEILISLSTNPEEILQLNSILQ